MAKMKISGKALTSDLEKVLDEIRTVGKANSSNELDYIPFDGEVELNDEQDLEACYHFIEEMKTGMYSVLDLDYKIE